MTHDDYVKSIKSSLLNLGKKAVLDFIFSKVSLLAWGPLGVLVEMVVSKILDIFINEAETAIFFEYIDVRSSQQGNDFSQKAIDNFKAQQSGTPDEKAKAEKALIDSFRNFASFMR